MREADKAAETNPKKTKKTPQIFTAWNDSEKVDLDFTTEQVLGD